MRAAHLSGVAFRRVVERPARELVSRSRAVSGWWVPSRVVFSAALGAQGLKVRRGVVVEVGDVDDFEALGRAAVDAAVSVPCEHGCSSLFPVRWKLGVGSAAPSLECHGVPLL